VQPPTLLVIDVQRAFDDPGWAERNNQQAEKRVGELLAAWRAAGRPGFDAETMHRTALASLDASSLRS